MTLALFYKLLAIVLVVVLGWIVGRLRWLGDEQADPARVLANAAFYLFAPALLFRTTARIELATLPWHMLAAFFLPTLGLLLLTYGWNRWRRTHEPERPAALAATRAITVSFGNSVQVGIPLAAALLGEAGLGLHLTLVSLHALVLLTVLTLLVESDLAREQRGADRWVTLRTTLRNTVIHPVVLPVLAGLAWNVTGWPLPGPLDEVLQVLGSAVVPLCLTLMGMSLAYLGLPRSLGGAMGLVLLKMVVHPLWVLGLASSVFGLRGLALNVVVLMASLPSGSNALLFAQRYRVAEAEVTAAMVISTLLVAVSVPLWMSVLAIIAA
jgi:malonate transporter and related proteins